MKFDDWLEMQFGKCPNPGLSEALKDVDRLKMKLRIAELKLRDIESWLSKRNAALYAWQIKEKDKK